MYMKYFGDGGSKTKKIDYIDIYVYINILRESIYMDICIYTQLYIHTY